MKILTDAESPLSSKEMVASGKSWIGGIYNGGYAATCKDNIQNLVPLSADTSYVCSFL